MSKKIILCGVGNRCREIYPFIKYLVENKHVGRICGAIDINPDIQNIDDLPVSRPEILDDYAEDGTIFFITVSDKDIIQFYRERIGDKPCVIYENIRSLAKLFDLDLTELRRDFCAYRHISGMDDYFLEAEETYSINIFWEEESPFKQQFNKLDYSNIIELACGRGRHVNKYIEYAGYVTLVDILQKNIDICKERFKNYTNISYYKNNGFDLHNLSSESYSALFCYDAMVHFELLDISNYLKEIFRVLHRGGKALLHHSNYDAFYDGTYANSICGRAFMNYKIFAYLALQAGFRVLKQEVIDWPGGAVQLDCITLLEKPD